MPRTRYLAALACALFAVFAFSAVASATITSRTIDYGPWTIPAGNGDPHDHEEMGMITNDIDFNVSKPCTDCDLIAIVPELVYEEGREANLSTGPMLHHFLFAATGNGKRDLVCGSSGSGALGERFFASGNERTPIDVSSLEYGYHIAASGEQWNMVTDLMNWQTTSKRVLVRVRFTYATGTDASRKEDLSPLWLDADGCSNDSLIEAPEGRSDLHRDIRSPISGDVIAAAGHIHDHGINVELTNRSRSEASICNSVATYSRTGGYETPDGRSHVADMSTCIRDPVATISNRDTLRLHTIYEVPVGHGAIDDAMGIMIAWVDQ
jgi:hypothetical protein